MNRSDSNYRRTLATNLRRALQSRRLDEARTLLARLQQEAPLAVETRGFELELAFLAGRLDEAWTLARELVKAHPESARIRFLEGRVAYARKDFAASAEAFEQSLRLFSHWRATRWLGKALTQKGDYDRAEPLLLGLSAEHPTVALDLAWLYERRGDLAQAADRIETYLERFPEDKFARDQRLRIESRRASAETLREEIESLEALDESPPAAIVPSYVERLLTSAQGDEARQFIQNHVDAWDTQVIVSVAWVCYRCYAQDLACDLFLRVLPDQLGNFKLLNALEAAARHCRRETELIDRYGEMAEQNPRLFGRIKRLQNQKTGN